MQAQKENAATGMGRYCRFALPCLIAMIPGGRCLADSITLHPSADTSLFAAFPNNNLGSSLTLVSGANGSGLPSRALLRFDIANQIPSNAALQSVDLTLNVVTVPGGGGVASVFDLRAVLVDWEEGVGGGNTGSPANDNESTWNSRIPPLMPWTIPGGDFSHDFAQPPAASAPIGNQGSYKFISTTKLIADVEGWLANPDTNRGWVLASESENIPFTARRFGSREDAANTPVLVVQYLLPPAPAIQEIKVAGNQLQFNFLAWARQPYTVQYRDSLNLDGWLTLTNISPQITTTNLIIFDSFPSQAQRFYRIGLFQVPP